MTDEYRVRLSIDAFFSPSFALSPLPSAAIRLDINGVYLSVSQGNNTGSKPCVDLFL